VEPRGLEPLTPCLQRGGKGCVGHYLKEKSDKGALYNNNSIYKKLDDRAKSLPGLRRALNSLNVKYV
jgi:hypothetical protein